MAGNIALQSPYGEYGSGTQRPAYLAYGTSSRRFTRLRGKGKLRFSGRLQKQFIDIQRFLVFALKGPLPEGAGSAVFFRRDWRSFDLGFCFNSD